MPQDNNLFIDGEIIEEPQEEKEIPAAMSGVCPRCLNTNFVHDVKEGVLGILYVPAGTDSDGRPKKRLVTCDHNSKYSF